MIAAACTARAPVAPATQRPARSLRALVVARAQRAPVQRPSEPHAALQTVVRALETAAVVAAVGAHVAAAAATVRQQQAEAAQRSQQQQQVEQQNGRRVAHVAAAPAVPQGLAVQPPAWAAPTGLWLTLPLLAALVLGRIRAWLSSSSDPRRVSTEAAARLLRAEAAAGQQAQRIEELARQLDKLSVRSRVGGRDLKLPIQQLQAAAGQQAEALVSVAARMEKLEKEIRDTEELVGAMQGVSAKQFALLLKVLEQQQAQRAQQAQQAAAAEPPPQAHQRQAERQEAAAARSTTAGGQPSPAGAQQQGGSAAAAGQAAAVQTDEWGRSVRPLPSSPKAHSPPQATPPLPSASPARAMSMGDPLCPLGSLPTPSCSADSMAAAAAAAAAEGLLSYNGNEEEGQAQQTEQAQQAQQAQQARQRQGLNQDSLLGIMGEDDFWKAEQQIISAVVNQPKAAQKPEVEILPPLFPPPPELTPEEAALQRKRREQVEEWRLRMRRSWDMSQLEAALEASFTEERKQKEEEQEAASHDEEEGVVGAAAAAEAPTMPNPSSELAPGSSGADAGSSGADAGGSADAGSSSAAAFGGSGGSSFNWGGSGGSFGGDHGGDDGGDD